MRKSHISLIIAAALVMLLGVGVTVAYLVTSSNVVKNTFTVGFVDITLTETTGKEYKIIPGATVAKDPTITVVENSEECWLFVSVEKTDPFDTFCNYEMSDGWTALAGHSGIYYRKVGRALQNMSFQVLKDNCVLIYDTVTEELLNTVTNNPILKFTAYAAQSDGFETAHEAWQILNP